MGDTAFFRMEGQKEHAFLHNSRTGEPLPSYVNRVLMYKNSHFVFTDKNLGEIKFPDINQKIRSGFVTDWIERKLELEDLYQQKTGQKIQAKTHRFKEGLFVFKENHTDAELAKVVERFGQEYGVKVVDLHIHRDEGHYDKEEKKWVPNLHAHFTFENICREDFYKKREKLDEAGNVIKRFSSVRTKGKAVRFSKDELFDIQTFFAKELKMQRGKSSDKHHLTHVQHRIAKVEQEVKALETSKKNVQEEITKLENENTRLGAKSDTLAKLTDRVIEQGQKVLIDPADYVRKNIVTNDGQDITILVLNNALMEMHKKLLRYQELLKKRELVEGLAGVMLYLTMENKKLSLAIDHFRQKNENGEEIFLELINYGERLLTGKNSEKYAKREIQQEEEQEKPKYQGLGG